MPRAFAAGENESLWDFGVAASYMQLEHYPGSKEFSWVTTPVPIVEYRGKVSRVDQNDGARAFLLKGDYVNLDLSGGLLPGQNFASDSARTGMPQLPWVLNLGPQIVGLLSDHFQLRLGVFQSMATDFHAYRNNGQYYDTRLVFQNQERMPNLWNVLRGDYIAFSLQGASQTYMSTYYDVASQYATVDRPTYSAKAGAVCDELALYETFKSGLNTVYFGAYLDRYDIAANHDSPLLQSKQNFTFFVAYGYTFERSKKPSVDNNDTEGLINRFKQQN